MFWRFPHFALRRYSLSLSIIPRSGSNRRAFSLVEVVLAVGITSFILIAVFGMTAVAVKGTREADINARLAEITRLETSLCQMEHFASYKAALPATNYYNIWSTPIDPAYGYFRCDLSNVTPAGTSSNLVLVQLMIRWPVPQLAYTNTSIISLANHE